MVDEGLLLPPQVPQVEDVKRVVLYDHLKRPLIRVVGFKGGK